MKNSREYSENSAVAALRSIVFGTVTGAVICAVLLAVCAIVFVSSKHIPQSVIPLIALIAAAVSAFFSGYVAAKRSRERGLLLGTLAGLLLFFLIFVSGLILVDEPITAATVTKLMIMMISGAIGGVAAVNKKSKIK